MEERDTTNDTDSHTLQAVLTQMNEINTKHTVNGMHIQGNMTGNSAVGGRQAGRQAVRVIFLNE